MSIAKGSSGISVAYLGGNSVTRMYLGNDLVFSHTEAVSYLECTGTQYINTGISMNGVGSFEIEVDFAPTRFFNYNDIWCIGDSDTTNAAYMTSDGTLMCNYNGGVHSGAQLSLNTEYVLKVTYQDPTFTIYLDNVQQATFDTTPTTETTPLWLFSRIDYAEMKVYGFSIVINGMSSMNCTPYKNGGVGCFYDYVGGNYIYSDGSDDFVAGS